MDFMKAFMDQHMIAMIGEIVLFANTVTMAMPTRWRNRKIYRGAFIGRGQNSGKQLVFKKGRGSKQIKAVHGASLPREFER